MKTIVRFAVCKHIQNPSTYVYKRLTKNTDVQTKHSLQFFTGKGDLSSSTF